MTKINSTLDLLVEDKTGGNKSKFAKKYLKDRPTNLENWISGTKSPTIEKIDPIFEEIENLNLNWFFRGTGEMYIDDNRESKLELELEAARKEIQQKDELIEFYKDIIKNSIKKDANFQTGDPNGLLADDILMIALYSDTLNKSVLSMEN